MRITIEKLRIWIVLSGVLLVLALVAFFVYARYRVARLAHDLPQKMGLEIQQSTNNFTISKSSKGRTLFVLHAAKAVQYKNAGRAVLHDVSIELYGADGSQTDRISGSEFEYNPSTKTVRADGTVDILLSDPRAHVPGEAGTNLHAESSPKIIHVKTRGLVFNQETQIASTTQALTFLRDGSSGSARGAIYDGNKGSLSLNNDVVLNTTIDGEPIKVEARSAKYDRNSRQLFLFQQAINFQQRHGSSDQATIFFRPDGKTDHIRAEGHVHLRSDDGSDLRGSVGTILMDAAGTLQQVRLDGGLLFVNQGPVHSIHINSNSGIFNFVSSSGSGSTDDSRTASRLNHVRLTGAVSAVDQQIGLGADVHGSETRETHASQIDVDLKAGPANAVQAEHVLASGAAQVTIRAIHANAAEQLTKLTGDQIFSTLTDGQSLSTLRAVGNASLEQSTSGGLSQKSSADVLSVDFAGGESVRKPAQTSPARKTNDVMGNSSQIKSALLSGHAILVREQNLSTGSEKTIADADHISYQGETGMMRLTGGNPHIRRGESDLAALSIEFNHLTGDASASGGVRASYVSDASTKDGASNSPAANDVTHVVADHAFLNHLKDETTFYGTSSADARMWQGSDSISAPRIVLSRSLQSLVADGGVKANFVESNKVQGTGGPREPRVIRATSRSLAYSGGERKVTLSGGVQAREGEGIISAATIDLFLDQPAVSPTSASNHGVKSSFGPGGQVNRMIAEQNVRLTQGNRTGTGEKLVYTAEDGHFILTGSTTAPPLLADREHGTVTGSSLIFNDRDDSVVVNRGQAPTSTDSRTRSDPHGKSTTAGHHPTGRVQ